MEAYGKFAQVYDLFMDNIDYESWAAYVEKHLKARKLRTDWFWNWAAAQAP